MSLSEFETLIPLILSSGCSLELSFLYCGRLRFSTAVVLSFVDSVETIFEAWVDSDNRNVTSWEGAS